MKWIEPKTYLKKLELTEFPQPDLIELTYPVLLCHGYGGFAMLIAPSPLHHSCMRLRGYGIHAFAPNIVPYATIEVRAKQWVDVIQKLKKMYGYEKMNVVAHSMGGLDMRYAISKLGIADSVVSLTTVAAPHRGTSLAELVLTAPDTVKEKLGDLANWFGESIYPTQKSNAVAAVEQLTREYVTKEFNPNVPDADSVFYFSYSAAVGKGTNEPLNTIYRIQNQLIYQQEGANDSFVGVDSAKWGKHLKTLTISHLEQIDIQVSKERKNKVERFWKGLVTNLKRYHL